MGELSESSLTIIRMSLKIGVTIGAAALGFGTVWFLFPTTNTSVASWLTVTIGALVVLINLGRLKILKNLKGKQNETMD